MNGLYPAAALFYRIIDGMSNRPWHKTLAKRASRTGKETT
jgi:hypothetical protein